MSADENRRLRGLLWYAWHEFNAIRARHGAPIDSYGMRLTTLEWWDQMTEAFAEALGPDGTTPWPTPEAKEAIPPREPTHAA